MSEGTLPLFPLDLVLYPGETIPLHIFEPRYRTMIRECLSGDQRFGVVFSAAHEPARTGCVAEIARVLNRYPDGRLDIAVRGTSRFRVEELIQDREFLQARIEILEESPSSIDAKVQQRLIAQHMKLLEIAGRDVNPSAYEGTGILSFFIARNAGLTLQQKQGVLDMESEFDRISYLVSFLEEFIPRVERMGSLRKKVQSNGHFRDFPPDDETRDDGRAS